jgi:hypothetical protein
LGNDERERRIVVCSFDAVPVIGFEVPMEEPTEYEGRGGVFWYPAFNDG